MRRTSSSDVNYLNKIKNNMKQNKKETASIDFGGFYHSIHSSFTEQYAAIYLGYDDWDLVPHGALDEAYKILHEVELQYAKLWLEAFNKKFGFACEFLELCKPRFYNYGGEWLIVNPCKKFLTISEIQRNQLVDIFNDDLGNLEDISEKRLRGVKKEIFEIFASSPSQALNLVKEGPAKFLREGLRAGWVFTVKQIKEAADKTILDKFESDCMNAPNFAEGLRVAFDNLPDNFLK